MSPPLFSRDDPECILIEPLDAAPDPVRTARSPLAWPFPVFSTISPEFPFSEPPDLKCTEPPVLVKLRPAINSIDPAILAASPICMTILPDDCFAASPVERCKEPELSTLIPVVNETTPDCKSAEADATFIAPLL